MLAKTVVFPPTTTTIPSFNSGMVFGFILVRRKFFMDPHTFSMGLRSGLDAGVFHPLMFKVMLCPSAGVLGVIVLLIAVTRGVVIFNKRE